MVWQRLVVKELRLPGQAVKTRAAVVCPRSVYGDLRSLRAAQWIKPKQPVDGVLRPKCSSEPFLVFAACAVCPSS